MDDLEEIKKMTYSTQIKATAKFLFTKTRNQFFELLQKDLQVLTYSRSSKQDQNINCKK